MTGKLEIDEIIERIAEYEGWEQDGPRLLKLFEFDDFEAAVEFVNEIAVIAEGLNHHPDITVQNYNEVVLSVTTHDAGGITGKDFEFVDHVEKIR